MAREEKSEEDARMMQEWLDKGNKVTICPPCQRTDPELIGGFYQGGRKKKKQVDPVEAPAEAKKPKE